MTSPIDRMILGSVRCTNCGASYGQCDCWQKCPTCKCSFLKGTKCRRCHGDGGLEIMASTPPRKRKPRAAT